LLSLPASGGDAASSVAGGQDPVLHHLGVTRMLVSGYSLPPPAPPTISSIVDDQTARARRVTGHKCLWSSCVIRPANSCRTCSDARNIGFSPDTTAVDTIRYDTLSIGCDTDPIIVRSLVETLSFTQM